MTKKIALLILLVAILVCSSLSGIISGNRVTAATAATADDYRDRFIKLFDDIQKKGYLSPEGVPYHTVETLMVEAPDYGHLSTSEAVSFLTWLGAVYGKLTGDWQYYKKAWDTAEKYIIPDPTKDQPGVNTYPPSSPAQYAPEAPLPSDYPTTGSSSAPTGTDPICNELASAYGNKSIYQMHWLLDVDNWYKYGNHGDGTSRCSYINTYQRGPQESVWETVPHPSWEDFKWGDPNKGGFLQLFNNFGTPSKQWRYTSASDADGRQIQASYWAYQWAKEQGKEGEIATYTAKAAKMGDYLRYTMFDKYFRPVGVQNGTAAGTGYDSCHYLMSWYLSWGGDTSSQWSWRIGCSHVHQGYQNPMTAYALSNDLNFIPKATNAKRDWTASLKRQIELYQYLQSAEGAIAGGVTNSWNGRYDAYPSGASTFYKMVYDWEPVYHDPPSNNWFGMQAWSMERVIEYFYATNDSSAKALCDKWINWVLGVVKLNSDGTYTIPSSLDWGDSTTNKPDTWTGTPTGNSNLHCTVKDWTNDVGVAAGLAKALIYYAATYQKYTSLSGNAQKAKDTAQQLLDRMWALYRDDTGVACDETRTDYSRFFDEVYIPTGYNGKNGQGATIKNGMTFIDMRPSYKNDPNWNKVVQAHQNGTDVTMKYHRFWAQADIAIANALYYVFFSTVTPTPTPTSNVTPTPTTIVTPTPTSNVTPTPTTIVTPTPTPKPTPTSTAIPAGYAVSYVIGSDWGNGASINITIKNNGTSSVNGWTLAFNFPGNQKITNLWNGSYTQSGTAVTIKNASYNGTIPANGGTVNFGFNISYSGTNTKPTSFTLNGAACSTY